MKRRNRTEMRRRIIKRSVIRPELAFNQQRALWAAEALAAFPPNKMGGLSRQDALGDLLANLLHLAGLSGLSPLRMVRRAVGHFVSEEEAIADDDTGPVVRAKLRIRMDDEDYYD